MRGRVPIERDLLRCPCTYLNCNCASSSGCERLHASLIRYVLLPSPAESNTQQLLVDGTPLRVALHRAGRTDQGRPTIAPPKYLPLVLSDGDNAHAIADL